ncbi:unnamed protein product [Clonostachys rosea f. rosea IK726]|uniref:Uncharacterized protein n=1 Tax=Clonostachys rosea f. rosea IK726 TaxID=1349383 RepID=A0ACA9TI41_BIOOC|nr:unnamed protein product [Clonostachys rosea f. rosea IK726]
MTAVANPPAFPQLSRPAWGSIDGHSSTNPDEGRGMFAPRKTLSRTNSSSSVSSTSSNSSTSTALTTSSQSNGTAASSNSDISQWSAGAATRKRPPPKNLAWAAGKGDAQPDFSRFAAGRPNGMPVAHGPNQGQLMNQQGMMGRPGEQLPPGQPVLFLLSLNGTFERKTIAVPFAPDSLRIGRQTNQKTIPTATNGFFDSKVLSRQHAEIFAERNGKIYIRDVKSSNGTFVNGSRLSQENRESDPHELQTGDHLELGIDIVSEDQKTIVHHKVAAKVEHAGFMSPSSNVLDMSFGDLDPANSNMMSNGAMAMRGRAGSNASNGRMAPAGAPMNGQGAQQRPFFLSPIATDQILKRLMNEMRSARLQAQDLGRTNQFVSTLLSKNDVKDLEKSEIQEQPLPQHVVNGNGVSYRPDGKARFSEPPAPPPQQPLPEKPDVPSLKRGSIERPKSVPQNASPIRQDNSSQILQLTEALKNAKRDIDTQSARMRELEQMLQEERVAREEAEELAKRLEESASSQVNGVAIAPSVESALKTNDESEQPSKSTEQHEDESAEDRDAAAAEDNAAKEIAISLQSRIDAMDVQMLELKEQLEHWKQRCEVAESERDADRKTLAEMVVQLRAEEARHVANQKEKRSRSRRRAINNESEATTASADPSAAGDDSSIVQADGSGSNIDTSDEPTLSRANTITALHPHDVSRGTQSLQVGLPYASAVGVVLLGMGLMAFLNGWQAPSPRIEQ